MSDLSSEVLTLQRMQTVWEQCNLKNKSSLIEILTKALYSEFEKKAKKNEIDINTVSFAPDEVKRMCDRFVNAIIIRSIPPQEPLLESLPPNFQQEYPECMVNPPTGIVFKSNESGKPSKWLAQGVLKGAKIYPLKLAHMNVCITNGWYFLSERENISCPFAVK